MSRRRVAGLAVVAVLLLLFGGRWLAVRYTEHAWFSELGQASRWWALLWRALVWQAGVLTLAGAWYAANTLAVARSIGSVHLPRRVGNLDISEAVPRRALRSLALVIALVLGAATAYSFGDLDHLVSLWRHSVPFGLAEPVLGHDASFYLTRLRLLETLHLLALLSVVLAAALVVGLYALTGSVGFQRRRLSLTPHARTHLTLLLTALAMVVAWGFQIDSLQLVGGGGHAQGALTAVDRSVRIPASNALAGIGLVVAIGTALGLRWARAGLLLGLWATLFTAALLGRFLVPLMADAWGAGRNPTVEQAMAGYADGFTRAGFGLLEVRSRPLPVRADLVADSVESMANRLRGLPVWFGEGGLLESAVAAARDDSTPARVMSHTLDVYPDSAGEPRLVWVLVPQTDQLRARGMVPRPRWADTHRGELAWGGEPIALEATGEAGALHFLESLTPVRGATESPGLSSPGPIRFLPKVADLAVVGPDQGTFGSPPPGLVLGGFVRRLLFAWALQSPPLLDEHTSAADRLLVWRDVPTRLRMLYPFASFDAPRAVVYPEGLLWVSDGYLASARFPLASHLRWNGDRVNYLSAPYVATVDAVSGQTRLYLRSRGLELAASIAAGERAEALPAESLPAVVRRHVTYPRGLLAVQAAAVARRGGAGGVPGSQPWAMSWPDTATALADLGSVRPAGVLLSLDGGPSRHWQLVLLVGGAEGRLAAIVAGSVDAEGLPVLTVLHLTGDDLPSPASVASRVASAPGVLAAVAAAAGPEGATRRGPVIAVPAGGTVAYAQALFATESRAGRPLLLRAVVVSVGGRVGVGADYPSAARALTRPESQGSDAGASSSLAEARAAFLALDSAVRAADWARFARAYEALRRALSAEESKRP